MGSLKCSECKSSDVVKRGKRFNRAGKKQLYLCKNCGRTFVEDDGFKRMRHKSKTITRAIHMNNDGLSLFQVQNHLWQYDGIKVSREAIRLWVKKYSIFLKSHKGKSKTKTKRKTTP